MVWNPGREEGAPTRGKGWWDAGLAALILLTLLAEVAFVLRVVERRGLFEYVGLDYRGTRSAGEAILAEGPAAAYDRDRLEASQRRIYQRYVRPGRQDTVPFDVVPAPYPPPFSLAFVPSVALPPVMGFIAWTALHALVLVLYQLRLARAFGVPRPAPLVAAVAVSLPAFVHIIMGQISVWLMVFFGEALIAFTRGRDLRSGAWLAPMLTKPQSLVLVLPALAAAARWQMLAGVALGAVVVFVPVTLVDPGWITAYFHNVLPFFDAAGAEMTAFPSSMVNWRAAALNGLRFLPPTPVWVVAGLGMAVTAAAGLYCARRLGAGDPLASGPAWLGIAAAGLAFSWHSHVHQTLVVVPPLFMVLAAQPRLRAPTVLVLAGSGLVFVVAAALAGVGPAHNLLGVALFAALLAVTAACVAMCRHALR